MKTDLKRKEKKDNLKTIIWRQLQKNKKWRQPKKMKDEDDLKRMKMT